MLPLKVILSILVPISAVLLLWIVAIMPKLKRHPMSDRIKGVRYAHRGLFSPSTSFSIKLIEDPHKIRNILVSDHS